MHINIIKYPRVGKPICHRIRVVDRELATQRARPAHSSLSSRRRGFRRRKFIASKRNQTEAQRQVDIIASRLPALSLALAAEADKTVTVGIREKYGRLKFPVVSEEFPFDSIPRGGQNKVPREVSRALAHGTSRSQVPAKFRCFLRARAAAPEPAGRASIKRRVRKKEGEKRDGGRSVASPTSPVSFAFAQIRNYCARLVPRFLFSSVSAASVACCEFHVAGRQRSHDQPFV